MDRAYEGDETRRLAEAPGFVPFGPLHLNRVEPWEYDRVAYRRRNKVKRFFRLRHASCVIPAASALWQTAALTPEPADHPTGG